MVQKQAVVRRRRTGFLEVTCEIETPLDVLAWPIHGPKHTPLTLAVNRTDNHWERWHPAGVSRCEPALGI